jgi:Flp pilus assembly protein CpaB
MTYRVRNIVVAVVLAALAALMTSYYVTNYKRHVQSDEKHVEVYVAGKDIPAGTSGADAARMLAKKEVTQAAVAPGAIAEPKDIAKRIAAQRIYAGEQVTVNRFVAPNQNGVRGDLKGTLRAFAVAGNANQVLAGTLKEGDHVDLVANFKYKVGSQSSSHAATRIVLRDVKVLRAPSGGGPGGKITGGLESKYTIMLAVTDNQSQKLMFTTMNSVGSNSGGDPGWWLELRPTVNAADSPDSVETLDTILRDGLSRAKAGILYGKFGG